MNPESGECSARQFSLGVCRGQPSPECSTRRDEQDGARSRRPLVMLGVPRTLPGAVWSLPHGSLTVASLLMQRGFPQTKCPKTARRKPLGLCSPRLTLLSVGSLRGAQLEGKRQRPHFPTGKALKNLQTCFKSTIALCVFVRGWDGWMSTCSPPIPFPPSSLLLLHPHDPSISENWWQQTHRLTTHGSPPPGSSCQLVWGAGASPSQGLSLGFPAQIIRGRARRSPRPSLL